jgi:hypothetical protein
MAAGKAFEGEEAVFEAVEDAGTLDTISAVVVTKPAEKVRVDRAPIAWGPALRMLERLELDLQPLVSATFPFRQIDVALARAADAGRETKVLVHP